MDVGGGEGHFDFVEIGTSHFHTLTQAAAAHPDGKPNAWRYLRWSHDPTSLRGLAVDMEERYLRLLPDLPHVKKVQAAVSDRDGSHTMHHVPLRDIGRWERALAARGSLWAYRAVRMARGCSTLGRHSLTRRNFGKLGLRHLIRTKRVRIRSMGTLLEEHGVKSIGVLALDCEGHDCSILNGLLRACKLRPDWHPYWILFETNGMNDDVFGPGTERRTIRKLIRRGYKVVYGGGLRESGKRDTVLKRCW